MPVLWRTLNNTDIPAVNSKCIRPQCKKDYILQKFQIKGSEIILKFVGCPRGSTAFYSVNPRDKYNTCYYSAYVFQHSHFRAALFCY
jgi:hypothetical protein